MDRSCHPAVQGGGEQRTVQAGSAEMYSQGLAVKRSKLYRAAVELLHIGAEFFKQTTQLSFLSLDFWCDHGFTPVYLDWLNSKGPEPECARSSNVMILHLQGDP